MAGKLIVLEGVEGSGKTTQLQHLRNWLSQGGWQAVCPDAAIAPPILVTREPGGTDLGLSIRKLLLEPSAEPIQDQAELLLYAADRAQHVAGYLKPALAEGAIVLCDRYTDSTVAYQGYGRGLDLKLIQQLNEIATMGLVSDLTLWLDVDAAVGLARTQKRGQADRMEANTLAFHQRVQQGFRDLAAQYPERIVRIGGDRPESEVTQAIQTQVKQWFQKSV